eukprot:COSAG02_NODE_1122_length_14450_cov_4.124173_11_plen_158_part_00
MAVADGELGSARQPAAFREFVDAHRLASGGRGCPKGVRTCERVVGVWTVGERESERAAGDISTRWESWSGLSSVEAVVWYRVPRHDVCIPQIIGICDITDAHSAVTLRRSSTFHRAKMLSTTSRPAAGITDELSILADVATPGVATRAAISGTARRR